MVAVIDDAGVGGIRSKPLPVLLDRVLGHLVVEAAVAERVRGRGRPLAVGHGLTNRPGRDLEVRLVHGVVRADLDVTVLAVDGRIGDQERLERLPVGRPDELVACADALRTAHEDVVL